MSATFIISRIIMRDIIINILMYSCKYTLFLSNFNETWIFSTDSLKILHN